MWECTSFFTGVALRERTQELEIERGPKYVQGGRTEAKDGSDGFVGSVKIKRAGCKSTIGERTQVPPKKSWKRQRAGSKSTLGKDPRIC